ncbi:MAG TPA: hypothetical protein VLA90_09215 [Actinomycetota bacterium]|nr:hypothetical protein [Actinomycetota bacterium]
MDQIPEPPGSPRLFHPRTVGEILGDAFGLYTRHWRNLLATVAVIVVPLALVQVLLIDLVIDETFTDGTTTGTNGSVAAAVAASLVVAAITVLMWALVTGAITRAAAGTFLGRDLDVRESYTYGLSRFWSIVWVGVLSALAIAAGFIALVIPGFFVLTRLTCALPALVIEGRRGTTALSRSWNLVAGRGWPVFGTIIVAGLLTGIVGSLLTAPFGDNTVARAIGQSLSSVITTPYMSLVGILIYLDLRVRKEGYTPAGLELDLAQNASA